MAPQALPADKSLPDTMTQTIPHLLGPLGEIVSETLENGGMFDPASLPSGTVDYRLLFEFPALLINNQAEKAIAILYQSETETGVLFLVIKDKRIDVIQSKDAPVHLADFALSFANILCLLPDCSIAKPSRRGGKSLQ